METRRKWCGGILFMLSPLVMYVVFEGITRNLTSIRGIYLFLNLIFFYIVYLTVFAVTNSMKIGFPVLNFIFTFWAMAEYFVVDFRQRPIMLWDILAVRTAAAVAGNYHYVLTKRMIAGIVIMVIWSVLVWKFSFKIPGKKRWGAAALVSLAVSAFCLTAYYRTAVVKFGIEINMWEPRESYSKYGYMLASLRVPAYLFEEPPADYSLELVKEIKEEVEAGRDGQELPFKSSSNIVPANIICIMNESYADLRVIAPFSTDIPFMAYYEGMEENCIKGELYVPVFGAMTSNTEFEFLTANNNGFTPMGSVPYQFYMKDPTHSLARILKAQGYRTVAVHPNGRSNWNRDEAYEAMGFDEFLDITDFEDPELLRSFVSDKGDYKKLIELTEGKAEGERLFIFNVTMQNHGGYGNMIDTTVHLTDYEGFPMTEQYLTLIRESDMALAFLLDYYSQVEEPTMIVMFGDHQPSVEESFYEALYGCPLDQVAPEDFSRRYITPFFIWTNYETESMDAGKMSAQYLSGAILQRANLEMTDYQYFINAMSKEAPVLHMLGYYNDDMEWETWDGWGDVTAKKEYPLFHKFEILQYHNMFERNRIDEFFSVQEGH